MGADLGSREIEIRRYAPTFLWSVAEATLKDFEERPNAHARASKREGSDYYAKLLGDGEARAEDFMKSSISSGVATTSGCF